MNEKEFEELTKKHPELAECFERVASSQRAKTHYRLKPKALREMRLGEEAYGKSQ